MAPPRLRSRPPVQGSDGPPPPRKLHFEIESPGINAPLRVVFLGDRPFCAYTHYVDPRTYPCVDVEGGCPHCIMQRPRRWYGYAACMEIHQRRRLCVRITEYAATKSPWLTAPAGSLRGVVATYYRMPTKSKTPGWETRGRCYFGAPEAELYSYELPAAFDERELLWQVWEAESKQGFPVPGPPAVGPDGQGPTY